MQTKNSGVGSIDQYIATFPEPIQELLQTMRTTIQAAAPEAEERINYQMPTFTLHGNLVHFVAFKQHIGFYPTPSGISAFQEELAIYPSAKGSVQFPHDMPLPLELISKIVRFRVEENLRKAAATPSKKKRTSE